jgi:hypothetical protein
MKVPKAVLSSVAVVAVIGLLTAPTTARGELQWQTSRLEPVRLRLVALAWNHLPSSFFSNEEIFIAEIQIAKDESRLVKLVYNFLPYQPRLSENGLSYSTVHELRAARDPQCDETLMEITNGQVGDWRQQRPELKYSADAPVLNMARHRNRLPCYVTSATDYQRPVHEPVSEQ